jgi:hypothetical protein
MCKYGTALLLLLMLVTIPRHVGSQTAPSDEVQGTVKNFLGAGIANVKIEFASGANIYPALTGATGTYSIHLPLGTYSVQVVSIQVYCLMRRSGLVLKEHEITNIDFEIVPCGTDTDYRAGGRSLRRVPQVS